jgi:hypothetical protein
LKQEKDTNRLSVDIDGDGKSEEILVKSISPTDGRYQLTVGTVVISGKFSSRSMELWGVRAMSISGGKQKQLLVLGSEVTDTRVTHVYGYQNKQLRRIGEVPFEPEVPGNGALYGSSWMGFWEKKEKYVFEAGRIRLIPQEQYYVGKSVTVKTSFLLLTKRGGEPLATLGEKSKIELLTCVLDVNDYEKHWYLIRSEKGLLGWAQYRTFQQKVDGLIVAG